jgi:integrase
VPLPTGLKFKDRHAYHEGRHYFQCNRGHKRIRLQFISKADYERARAQHDAEAHDVERSWQRAPGVTRITVGSLVEDFNDHIHKLYLAGKRSRATVLGYEGIGRMLVSGFGELTHIETIDRQAVSDYIEWRRSRKPDRGWRTPTGGAVIAKELTALRTMLHWKTGYFPPWAVPLDEIRPKKRKARSYTVDQLVRFVRSMPEGSVERGVCTLKLHTGLRSVEIFSLRVGDVDLPNRRIEFILRNKKGNDEESFAILTETVVEAIAPLMKGKRKGELVFTLRNGAPLTHWSLRKRLAAASRKAKITPPIVAIGAFRAEAITALSETEGMELHEISQAIDHKSVKTTEKHYVRRKAAAVERRKARMATALEERIPL